MAQIIKDITVDTGKLNLFPAIVAKQNDSYSRFLRVTVVDEGAPVAIDTDATIVINAERQDQESKSFAGSVNEDGTLLVPITNWMLALDDTVRCDISIITSDSKLTSTSFSIEVEAAANPDGEVEKDEQYDILTELINECKSTKAAYESAQSVYITVTDGTATINAHYNNTQDISYRFGKWNANNLPEFMSFGFIDNGTQTVSDSTSAPYHYVTPTDYFAPYNVAALSNGDGDVTTSNNYTGGNHVYTKSDGTPILTAKNNYLRFYADGHPITGGGQYCSKIRIEWANDIMGWNTVKMDGAGRYIMTEAITMTFDGERWEIEKIITSKEDSIRIRSHHGLQFSLKYCDRKIGYAKFLGSDTCREIIPNNRSDYAGSHADGDQIYCDDKLCDTILISDDTNAVQFGMYPCGLGRNNDCVYERTGTVDGQSTTTISSAYVSTSKAYFNPIWYKTYDSAGIPDGVELKKDESVYLRGFYRFYPADPTAENTNYTITTVTEHVTAKADNPTSISKRGAAYLYFTPDEGYTLPDTVTVTGASKSWTKSSGCILLTAPTGEITVSVTGVPATITSYSITVASQFLTASDSNPTTISEGGTAELLFTSPTAYSLPETVSVTNASYVWDKHAGKLTLSNPTGEVLVIASGVSGETWEIIENPTAEMMTDMKILESNLTYTAGGESYKAFYCQSTASGAVNLKMYTKSTEEGALKYSRSKDSEGNWTEAWSDEKYRTIKIANASVNANLLTWLTANALKL